MSTSRRTVSLSRVSVLLSLAALTSCHTVKVDQGPSSATFDLDGTTLVVTEQDGEAILGALLASLSHSELARRDDLLARTQKSSIVPEQGALRLGAWVLSASGSELVLQYRYPPTPAGIEAYGAKVEQKQGTWSVGAVSMQHIHRRR